MASVTHPMAVDQRVRERQQELARLAQAERQARQAAACAKQVRGWRRAVSRMLVVLGVQVGVPFGRRGSALREVVAALDGPRCTESVRMFV